jgi:hypothetical protein
MFKPGLSLRIRSPFLLLPWSKAASGTNRFFMKNGIRTALAFVLHCSVVDPDPVGPETFGKIRIWKNYSGSGYGQLRIRNEFDVNNSEKLIKLDNFSTKILD